MWTPKYEIEAIKPHALEIYINLSKQIKFLKMAIRAKTKFEKINIANMNLFIEQNVLEEGSFCSKPQDPKLHFFVIENGIARL